MPLLALKSDKEGRNRLKHLIKICFNAQATYGKTPEQLANLADVMIMVLEDYPYPVIEQAFKTFIRRNRDMPTPSDIINIIEPQEEPFQWSRSEYKRLKDVAINGWLSHSEREYINGFEAARLNGERIYS